jgi:hypothetical protein
VKLQWLHRPASPVDAAKGSHGWHYFIEKYNGKNWSVSCFLGREPKPRIVIYRGRNRGSDGQLKLISSKAEAKKWAQHQEDVFVRALGPAAAKDNPMKKKCSCGAYDNPLSDGTKIAIVLGVVAVAGIGGYAIYKVGQKSPTAAKALTAAPSNFTAQQGSTINPAIFEVH